MRALTDTQREALRTEALTERLKSGSNQPATSKQPAHNNVSITLCVCMYLQSV